MKRHQKPSSTALAPAPGRPPAEGELAGVRKELEDRVFELARANVRLVSILEAKEQAERDLEDSRVFYRSLVENVPYALYRKDVEGRYTFANRRYREIHGDDLVGKTDYDLYPPELARKYREDDRRTVEGGEALDVEEEHQEPGKPGARQVVHTIKCPILDGSGRPIGIQGMFADVTERRRAIELLAHQARHDSLTGLPNRDRFQDLLEAMLDGSSGHPGRLAVLIVDLDRFREINDTFGHHFGDRVLTALIPRFEAAVGRGEVVARLGGDEFALILPGAGRGRATRVADQLLKGLGEPLYLDGQTLDIDASIGVALHPDHGDDRVTLMRHADVAMYAAKRARCGHAVYSADQSPYHPRRMAMIADLRRAAGLDQLLLHYQPKVDLATGEVDGAEALIRWWHPRDGLISPGQFIPLAEQTGLIREIDLWAAARAMEESRAWVGSGRPLMVSVNLAATDLQDPTLVAHFARMLAGSGVPARRLIVEVTESAMMADPRLAREVLGGLHDMGVKIAIDDFGTGYSSLAYLKDLPIDEVKIDQSFIREMAEQPAHACIVRAVVDLGHNLGLRVTAEGVEDARTLDLLARLGCDLAQGYHISRPLPAPEFQEWLGRQAVARGSVA